MLNNVNTNVERIIAKIDNDFNPDNSDWIPRVGAWVIDAMGQVDALRKVRKKIKLIVCDRIAYSNCPINSPNLIVYDNNNCVINKHKSSSSCSSTSSTGEISQSCGVTPNTIDIISNDYATNGPNMIASQINSNDLPARYNYTYLNNYQPKDYILLDNYKVELNFNTNYIYVETDVVETEISQIYQCEVPIIPNVPELIENIAWWCVYKMLCRGTKHPVFNLGASQYGTNPYYEWKISKDIAKRAVIIAAQGNINKNDNNKFQSAFFITTFK